ncbi:MAG: tryptophan halogenase [Alteromonadaceae bacterium]|jgi:tryptophan halogenase
MTRPIKQLLIVGGGTAGWITAGIIAAEHNASSLDAIKITLIESPEVNTIGVGEGTWPTMRATLETIGISEAELFKKCDASFKQGSQFINWVDNSPTDNYYHPFVAPHGFGNCNHINAWQQTAQNISFAHSTSFQPHLCDAGLAPKQKQTPEYAAVANYGYHLNATKFAQLLKEHCINRLGVQYISDHVCGINGDVNQDIDSISTKNNGVISADLFIDCSGSKSLLLGEHYKIPLLSQKDTLFNDSAIAIHLPYASADIPIASHTISTAQSAGWIWDIALPNRRGIGYTYSSRHINEQDAILTLTNYIKNDIKNTIDVNTDLSFKKLSFEPGYRAKFWHKNCVAVGMSAGFLEPLEASALALVELSAKMISKELPVCQVILPITAERFNKRFTYRWQRIIEFLKLHYVLSQRTDSDYWLENRHNSSIPSRLLELLTLWQYQEPSFNDFTEIEEVFPAASYHYILYGMGFNTQIRESNRKCDDPLKVQQYLAEHQQLCRKYLSGLPSNRELIEHILCS